jgi:hypothetical protein
VEQEQHSIRRVVRAHRENRCSHDVFDFQMGLSRR